MAEVAAPLYELISQNKKFEWTKIHDTAFNRIRAVLVKRIPLGNIQSDDPVELYNDASLVAAGAVLKQGDVIISHYSHRFTAIEQRYSTFDREA